MIVTVTFNPSVDKYGETKSLIYDDPVRLEKTSYSPGGKGINVSRVLKRFEVANTALFFSGGEMGKFLYQLMEQENLDYEAVKIGDETRLNHTIYIQSKKKVLKLNDPGPAVEEEEWQKMLNLVRAQNRNEALFVFSGNLPAHTEPSMYARFLNAIAGEAKICLLDTESDILEQTFAECAPLFVKPNLDEAQRLLGRELRSDKDFVHAIGVLETKAKHPIITAGEQGAFYRDKDDGKIYHVLPPAVEVYSTVGAGDSFVAGLIMSLNENRSLTEAVKMGVACGTATALTPSAELCYPNDVLDIHEQVQVREIG